MFKVTFTDNKYTVTFNKGTTSITFTGDFKTHWGSKTKRFNLFVNDERVTVINLSSHVFRLDVGEVIQRVVESYLFGNIAIVTNRRTIWCDQSSLSILPIEDSSLLEDGFSFWGLGEAKKLGIRDEKAVPVKAELFIDGAIGFN